MYRLRRYAQYTDTITIGALISLAVVVFVGCIGTLFDMLISAMLAFLTTLVVVESKVSIFNQMIRDQLNAMRTDHRFVPCLSNLVDYVRVNQIPVTFHQYPANPALKGLGMLLAMDRSDGDGLQIVFVEFKDDHDRVMYRLGE
jgi:hypothetical protein